MLPRAFIPVVLIIWAAGVGRLFYGYGSGEHDTFMMAAAVTRTALTGQVINSFCYAKELQFLFYYLARGITYFFTPRSQDVLLSMNVMGSVASLLIPFLLLLLLRNLLMDRQRAELAVLLVVTSPLYFYLVSYGHPFHLAMLLFLGGWLLLVRAESHEPQVRRWVLWTVATVLQSLAFMVRFEQMALFGLFLLALLAMRSRRRAILFLGPSLSVAVAAVLFFAAKALLIPDIPTATQPAERALIGYLDVVSLLLDPGMLKWGGAHMVAEIGLPILIGGALAAVICARRRQWTLLLVAVAGAAPSLAVYLANPSPPRHFYIIGIALAAFMASAVDGPRLVRLRVLSVAFLMLNLVTPWALVAVDGRPLPDRATVTYNVIERTDRNKSQISTAFPFYDRVVGAAEARPVVIFGSWIHLAQLASDFASDSRVEMRRSQLLPDLTAISFTGPRLQLYFVETYDPQTVADAVAAIKRLTPSHLCLSLLESGPSVNDLHLTIPPQIHWWTS